MIKEQIEDMKNGNFSDDDIANAKKGIISVVRMIPEEQDTEVTYYLGQELAEHKMSFEEYEAEVESVTKEEIMEFGAKVDVDTVYFLRN